MLWLLKINSLKYGSIEITILLKPLNSIMTPKVVSSRKILNYYMLEHSKHYINLVLIITNLKGYPNRLFMKVILITSFA